MKILVACEESQAVTTELRKLGHEAYSCDIIECSGGHPEWHIQGDVLEVLNSFPLFNTDKKGIAFYTNDGEYHGFLGGWDMVIAFPPCTYMSNAGACRMFPRKGQLNEERFAKAMEAKEFFMAFYNADCERVAIENPVPLSVVGLPEKTQVIQPYEYGHPYTKKTYLWLKGLPKLTPTDVVQPVGPYVCGNSEIWKKQAAKGTVYGKEKSAKHRSKTFPGVAKAMAEQWAGMCEEASNEAKRS